jgi:hypothetical protein
VAVVVMMTGMQGSAVGRQAPGMGAVDQMFAVAEVHGKCSKWWRSRESASLREITLADPPSDATVSDLPAPQ